jgi:hypothetical protein
VCFGGGVVSEGKHKGFKGVKWWWWAAQKVAAAVAEGETRAPKQHKQQHGKPQAVQGGVQRGLGLQGWAIDWVEGWKGGHTEAALAAAGAGHELYRVAR